jgi:hypothetical protein
MWKLFEDQNSHVLDEFTLSNICWFLKKSGIRSWTLQRLYYLSKISGFIKVNDTNVDLNNWYICYEKNVTWNIAKTF